LFVSAGSPISLELTKNFPESIIYDPTDIIYGNINKLNFKDLEGKRFKLKIQSYIVAFYQKLIIKRVKNIIFRDLSITEKKALSPVLRRKLNSLLFADYIDNQIQNIEKKNDKLKLVCCGNLNIYDFGNGLATFKIFELFLKNSCEVHMFPRLIGNDSKQTIYNIHPFLKYLTNKYSAFYLHDPLPHDKLIEKISIYDVGIDLVGEHYFKTQNYNNGYWKPSYYEICSSSRASSLINAKLPIIVSKNYQKNYRCFLIKRYGNLVNVSLNDSFENINDSIRKQYINNLKKDSKFYLKNNIPRLEKFYVNISENIKKFHLNN